MSEPVPTPEAPVNTTSALGRWLLVVGVTFVSLAFLFVWLARSIPIDSPTAAAQEVEALGPFADYESSPGPAGIPTPDFRLLALDGGVLGPPDYAGHVVIIDFWATWCGPCRFQAQLLEKVHEEMTAQGVKFLAVDVGEDLDTVRSYVEDSPFPYPVLLDENEELMMRYRITGLPTVMVIDREGEVSYLNVGITDVPTLQREVQKASGGASV